MEALRHGTVVREPQGDWTPPTEAVPRTGTDDAAPTQESEAKRFRYLQKQQERARDASGGELRQCLRSGCLRPRGREGPHEGVDGVITGEVEAVALDEGEPAVDIEVVEEDPPAPEPEAAAERLPRVPGKPKEGASDLMH